MEQAPATSVNAINVSQRGRSRHNSQSQSNSVGQRCHTSRRRRGHSRSHNGPRDKTKNVNNYCCCCFCGGNNKRRKGDSRCPATGKECSACGIIGHFGRVCQNSKRKHYSRANVIHSQTAGTADAQNNHFDYLEDEYTYIIRECQPLRDHVAIAKSNKNKLPLYTIKLNTISRAMSLN